MSKATYINKHYLYIWSGVATQEQLDQSVLSLITTTGICSKFKSVIVAERIKGICGYSYLWVESEELYNKLTGMKLDGSYDFMEIDNPIWEAPSISYDVALAKLEKDIRVEDYDNEWLWMQDLEGRKTELDQKYKPDRISIPAKPELKLPPYKYNAIQKAHWIEDAKKGTQFSADDVPSHGSFIVSYAYYSRDKPNINQNVLRGRIPNWVTESDIKSIFAQFIEDTTTEHKVVVNKTKKMETYPIVAITSRREGRGRNKRFVRYVYVSFDPKKGEGRMVILICRKLYIYKRLRSGKILSQLCIFNHHRINQY